jgi:hypothetical protein
MLDLTPVLSGHEELKDLVDEAVAGSQDLAVEDGLDCT